MTADGTGFNANEAQVGAAHCDLDCSGVRDADWDEARGPHAGHGAGFRLHLCMHRHRPVRPAGALRGRAHPPGGLGPGGARPQAAPFNLDSQTAFIVGNRLFYQGSGNIGAWHACTCGASSNGCGATNGYMQWLTADDDNGNLNDGTPHMTAIFAAFNRHGIACATPAAHNSGCAGGPSGGPLAHGDARQLPGRALLDRRGRRHPLLGVPHRGARGLRLRQDPDRRGDRAPATPTPRWRTAGRTPTTSWRPAASSACFGRASTCVSGDARTAATPDFTLACNPSSLSVAQGGSGSSTCTVASQNGFTSAVDPRLRRPAGRSDVRLRPQPGHAAGRRQHQQRARRWPSGQASPPAPTRSRPGEPAAHSLIASA